MSKKTCLKCGGFYIVRNGSVSGKQKYKCNSCLYQWQERRGKQIAWSYYYHQWLFGRFTLAEIASRLGISVPTLKKRFDALDVQEGLQHPPTESSINLVIDATYFGNEYGFICFHDTHKVIYFHEITTETSGDVIRGLYALKEAGYRFKSVTIDGRKGFVQAVRRVIGPVPVQLCLFHARATVRRYLGVRPDTPAARDLTELMRMLTVVDPVLFIVHFLYLEQKHHALLSPPVIRGNRKRQRIRLAYRFVELEMHRFFTYLDIPDADIPTTTNHLEGLFSHIKERVKLHRGLRKERKKKAVRFLLKHF